ncbi:unnamed protein product, partial [Vitis vinifera]
MWSTKRRGATSESDNGVVDTKMERGRGVGETHVLVIPYPVQGHINPMLQFSKRLASKGLKVTLITTTPTNNLDDYLERFKLIVSSSLVELIGRYNGSEYPVRVLVYDSVMSWAQDIVERLSVDGAPFFTQSCAVSTIYYHVNQGAFKIPLEGPTVSIPSMPILGVNDLPSFINDTSSYPTLWSLVKTQFSNFEKVNWVFFNTFCELEDEVVKWLASKRPIKTIGPTIPSMYLDRRIDDDEDYGLSLFKPNADACITWLDTKDTVSVVYVSFGSLASLGEEQMEELAWGLKRSNSQFLWVVRELEKKKLPSNFVEETSEKGLVVSWCPQLEVLAHKAVGCFMTHCGWNSTLEALSLGVPMVAMPQWTDQTTNAKFIEDVWGELAKEAVNEGGSSDNNIEEFVARLVCRLEERKEEESIEDYVERFRMVASQSLAELIKKHSRSSHPAKFLVYDSMMPWAQDVAEPLGLDGVPFFTQSCAVSTIYYHFNQGKLKTPLEGYTVSIPSMPLLCINDLPSFINDKTILGFLLKQFSNFQKVKWILFNTFDKLEEEVMKWMASLRPIKTIGPTVPSMYLDKRLEEDKEYGLSLFKQNVDAYIAWLDLKGIGSVVYASFGSMASLGEEQMEEIAWGLKRNNTHFMWFIEDVWGVGVRVKPDEKGLVKREEIEMCIREMMQGERGNEMRRNAEMWKELAKEAVTEGGTSDKNIEEFVAEILCSLD